MGSEYDRKFEEMKKYIPFLENMINQLESNSSSSANPRQAQLDKIRSLRDLLLDKKKRMKMDNLLKCEQVLVNLYAKVEKRDIGVPLGDSMEPRTAKDTSDLQAVRNKLKNVAKIQNVTETLPEIARASEREEVCEPGSKEPALFQRRPNRLTASPTQRSPNKSHETKISPKSLSRRSYTRVLVSPEPRTSRCWSGERSDDTSKEKPLYSRRSPNRSPRKSSPSYYKKERKKATREKKTSKDLNITLKVPEESLHSLNTEDILSRIITCSDGDVDIDTLRELRSQILGELKQTGTNDDISELILKSYNKKPKPSERKQHEVEEGEISDSESETIENIYGSLVVMDKDKKSGQVKTSVDKSNQQRKIQICLVINSDKEGENKPDNDLSESGIFENKSGEVIYLDSDTCQSPTMKKDAKQNRIAKHSDVFPDRKQDISEEIASSVDKESSYTVIPAQPTLNQGESESLGEISQSPIKYIDAATKTPENYSILQSNEKSLNVKSPVKLNNMGIDKQSEPTKNIANFYKPLLGDENVEKQWSETPKTAEYSVENVIEDATTISLKDQSSSENNNTEESTQIPLLNEPTLPPKATKDVLSEIDILQALKNEILSETIPLAAADVQTPALHQPKITKVASAVEVNSSNLHQTKVANSSQIQKKRISIENYKNKSKTSAKSLFIRKRSREEINKKQSLKLTEKECERFNFPARLSIDDNTDDISDTDLLDVADDPFSLNDIYGDLAPKSPDQDNFSDTGIDEPPVLIPAHLVKSNVSCSSDIDMRNDAPKLVTQLVLPQPVPPPQATIPLQPIPSSFSKLMTPTQNNEPIKNNNLNYDCNKISSNKTSDGKRTSIIDPRLRRELTQSTSPNPYGTAAFEGTPKPTQFPNIPQLMALNMTPVYTPSYTPSMTPIRTPNARSYEMTTNQSFEIDQPEPKHVYAPSFSVCDTNERDSSVTNDKHWETNFLSNSNEDRRSSRDVRNLQWETSSSGSRESQNNYNPRNDQFYIDRRDGYSKSECPPTPGSSFGWTDCPGTPRCSFRDTPMTPNHPFGRSDCPSTPIHPFGRSDCPSTPSHPFGRSDCPPTPNHPFGRNECPGTPIHQFGRNEIKDPRLNRRQFEFESRSQSDETDCGYQNDRNYNRDSTYKSHRNYGRSDSCRNYDREQHRKNERYPDEHGSHYLKNTAYDSQQCFDKEQSIGRNDKYYSNERPGRGFRRETSRAPRDDNYCLFTRNRDAYYDKRNSSNRDETDTLHSQKEKSIGRNMPGESSRAQSLSRNVVKEVQYGNTLPGKPQVARSFTIDTSVNATFQNLIESGKGIQVFDYTFDARRQRASSVGRSLTRESSIGRTLTRETKPTDSPCSQHRSNFKRASSVGRALVEYMKDKTLQEIKADFKAYRLESYKPISASKVSLEKNYKREKLESNSRSKNDNFENESKYSKQNVKQSYSPRKNYRDPRMRREQSERDKERNRNDRSSSHSRDRRHSGIVYSSDNIAKGTIMGSGFGVKNYKIPKIKRPDPEPEETKTGNTEKINVSNKVTSTTKSDLGNKTFSDKCDEKNHEDISVKNKTKALKTHFVKKNTLEQLKETKNTDSNEDESFRNKNKSTKKDMSVINLEEDLDKRVTRSSKKTDSQKFEEASKKKKRIRRNIIEDSGSEVETENAETEIRNNNENNSTKAKEISKEAGVISKSDQADKFEGSTSSKQLKKTFGVDSSDFSFANDDIEIFSNNASDPVIDNINDLIADLDNDLGVKSANEEIEKNTVSINSLEKNMLGDISELIEKDSNECNERLNKKIAKDDVNVLNHELELVTNPQSSIILNDDPVAVKEQEAHKSVEYTSKDSIPAAVPPQERDTQNTENLCEENGINRSVEIKSSNDEMVSTTHVEGSISNSNKEANEISVAETKDQSVEINELPTPDSTVAKKVQSDKTEESLPDSTIDINSEIITDVTSTRDIEKPMKQSVESSSRKEVSAMESIGSLLSILQDKSKIKELLSMLGDQSRDSEKIKKKLEKLSEIVSDEEDTNENTSNINNKQSDTFSPAHQCNVSSESRVIFNNIVEIDKESQFQNISSEKSDDIVKNTQEACPTNILEDNQENKKGNITETESSRVTTVEDDDLKNVKLLDAAQSNDQSKEHLKVSDQNTNDLNVHPTFDDPCNDNPNEELESNQDEESNEITEKIGPKKTRRGKGRGKKSKFNKSKPVHKTNEQRVQKPKIQRTKNMSRELKTLHEDIKEMFMSDDILNATGIRMCRLAKMVDKKRAKDPPPIDNEPVVEVKKYKGTENSEETEKKIRKKPGPKPKARVANESSMIHKDIDTREKPKDAQTYKPGPKSKTKQKRDRLDPYEFESDSVADTNTTKDSDAHSSDSENDSSSSETSIGSSEVLADIKKKPKKKRGSWQTGVIKPRIKKKKDLDLSNNSPNTTITPLLPCKPVTIPDMNCFTDKTYCFQRGIYTYDCRLCHYSGTEIVNHYKKQHTHTEVPLSRMHPETARKAIQQCEEINFQAISKIPSEKYTCRFCYKEFSKTRVALETFFWHVVSMHTGEYKHLCYECVNVTRCPFNLDIPPPPKDIKGQLIGYICGKCNFTQISLENLKTHVIVRHNDEQTEVYTINLGVMTNKAMKAMLRKSVAAEQKPRMLRSSRSNQSTAAASDDRSEITGSDRISEIGSVIGSITPKIEESDPHMDVAYVEKKNRMKPGAIKSKLRFETDDQERSDEMSVKLEHYNGSESRIETTHFSNIYNEPLDNSYNENSELDKLHNETVQISQPYNKTSLVDVTHSVADQSNEREQDSTLDSTLQSRSEIFGPTGSTDIFEQPHFKLYYKENGSKEYVCCINGEVHYRTTLLISLKKHVQTKHLDTWDGYCCVCKVIVTLQGVKSSFRDCLTHFLDKHIDDFPILQNILDDTNEDSRSSLRSSIEVSTIERTQSTKNYIAVRPLTDLIAKDVTDDDPPMFDDNELQFPKIENVVSLGEKFVEAPHASPVYPTTSIESAARPVKSFQYEEVQAEVMSKKHRIVLDTMMPKDILVRVFKCAGRFCSFTSDSAEDALVHASAHKQMGGEGALECAYCNFDAADNAIDLVMHVFKVHGRCQYSCVLCFYRAAADQLVGAHFLKAHGGTGKAAKVLRTTTLASSTTSDSTNMLSRETAVPYYICSYSEGGCRYRTYTSGKFCEHMQQKHGSEVSHPCNLCEEKLPTPVELVKHLKSHGVKLYQCTWCVHGADTESEMLSHAATAHPTKNPQAYLRIITNKDGSTDLRVLPLVYLNKLKVPIEEVIPSKVKENPTKEAERSIELEKLIRQTTPVTEDTTGNATLNSNSANPVLNEIQDKIIPQTSDITDAEITQATESLVSLRENELEETYTVSASAVVKKEPREQAHTLNQRIDVVYCLDSDEEQAQTQSTVAKDNSSQQDIIDLSDDELSEKTTQETPALKQLETTSSSQPVVQSQIKFVKLSQNQLFRCPECKLNFLKMQALKKHAMTCCRHMLTFRCPHIACSVELPNISQLINHYTKDHSILKSVLGNVGNGTKIYYCGLCTSNSITLRPMKKHMKDIHNVQSIIISSKVEENGTCAFTLHSNDEVVRVMPKRKTSIELPTKYGIEDVDKLPINPILDSLVYCKICEFSTKVRLNMVRHLQLHAERQPVPQTAPVNPVPHLETNEMHFDKMVNLASSSAALRTEKPPNSIPITPEAALRYPKYVPDRQRHTCGATGCSYISVDEEMLRCHWETLHSGTSDYHCVHCPPHQQLNTTRTLTASRILAHLKMHDVSLYACSSCSYYHFKRHIVEKHIADVHKVGHVQIVREEGNPVSTQPPAAPTMDLKPWQCGLCVFKSMLRPEVVEHCSKLHQTKMQYKCAYCPFRTSTLENITKHQANSHATRPEDVFYYYYREGTVPNEADGTPRWQKQLQANQALTQPVKTEPEPYVTPVQQEPTTSIPIDLNLVKKEVNYSSDAELSKEDLCKQFGEFCDPNGIKFKCPLCKTVTEHTTDAMRSHLYEELKYRRWSCGLCAYKAYHRAGLNEHLASEHRSNFIEPSQLPVNINIERWVSQLLDHQSAIISKNKENFAKQKIMDAPVAGPSRVVVEPPKPPTLSSDSDLEQAFGPLGTSKNNSYSCPKCNFSIKDEEEMRNHMESELTKIRWCCTKCSDKFQTYHEAQFHCKSHTGLAARPKEAIRDPSVRNAWISAVIQTQKQSMKPNTTQNEPDNDIDLTDTSENSLLVVRYEEAAPSELLKEITRKRPAEPDSDDDNLVICEPQSKKINDRNCPFCSYASVHKHVLKEHVLRHFNLKLMTCAHCDFNGTRKAMHIHLDTEHPNLPHRSKQTEIPNCLPSEYLKMSNRQIDIPKVVCLHCEKSLIKGATIAHIHENKPPEFGEKGQVVVKCCICLALRINLESMQSHYKEVHPDIENTNYAYYKLQIDTREVHACGICSRRFTFIRDLRIHHSAMHSTFNLTYKTVPYRHDEDSYETRGKRKMDLPNPAAKRIAKKSTSKLPKISYVAKKSTTKLPTSLPVVESDSEEEYSYYGTKPLPLEQYTNVKTMMPMYNTMVEIDVQKLSGILKIDPRVVVKDCKGNQ